MVTVRVGSATCPRGLGPSERGVQSSIDFATLSARHVATGHAFPTIREAMSTDRLASEHRKRRLSSQPRTGANGAVVVVEDQAGRKAEAGGGEMAQTSHYCILKPTLRQALNSVRVEFDTIAVTSTAPALSTRSLERSRTQAKDRCC